MLNTLTNRRLTKQERIGQNDKSWIKLLKTLIISLTINLIMSIDSSSCMDKTCILYIFNNYVTGIIIK